MKWSKTVGMKLKPNSCAGCGSTGEMTEEGPPEAYFAEGVDINWGDSLYLCGTCVRILGELRGMADVSIVEKVRSDNKRLQKELEAERKKHEALKEKVTRMLDGAKARKQAKEAVNQ